MAFGYASGQPFGDPAGFTRSTGADEIDRFNQWLRSQPWYIQARASMGEGDLSKDQRRALTAAMNESGVPLPKDFVIDAGGNLNQKSRTKRNLAIAGIAGGAALGGLGLVGIGPLGGLGGATAAGGATSGALSEAVIPTTLGVGAGAGAGTGAGGFGLSTALRYGVPMAGTFLSNRQQVSEARNARNQGVALQESAMDPFRHQRDQAEAIGALDHMERASYTPARYQLPAAYASGQPTQTGGYTYERSPEARASAGELKRSVMSGRTAPSMTDPKNYGRTGALDLLRLIAAGRR